MKKAKLMLTAITVLTIVGGALAFKAKDINNHTFYKTDPNGTEHFCTLEFQTKKTVDPINGILATFSDQPVQSTTCGTLTIDDQ